MVPHYPRLARDRERQQNTFRDLRVSACPDRHAPSPSVLWALLAARLGGTLPKFVWEVTPSAKISYFEINDLNFLNFKKY
jgi:hypothetical protein